MVDDFIAQFARDLVLQLLDLVRLEFNHLAGIDVKNMIMMLFMAGLEPRTSAVKSMAMHNATLLKNR